MLTIINTVDRTLELINDRNISLYELCKMSGINYSTVTTTKRRNGQLTVDTICRICYALEIPLYQFFIDPKMEPERKK